MPKLILAPSILSADFTRLGEELAACESAGADWIHIDVMDGHFVPNISMGPFIVEACKRATKLPLDVHLMIEKPERHIEAFAKAGASHIIVHIEACPHIHRALQHIQSLGCKAGVALNPGTPVGAIEAVLGDADQILVMSVNPGYCGRKGERSPQKIERGEILRAHRSGRRHRRGDSPEDEKGRSRCLRRRNSRVQTPERDEGGDPKFASEITQYVVSSTSYCVLRIGA